MADLCHEPHPDRPEVLCDKPLVTGGCKEFHQNIEADEIWVAPAIASPRTTAEVKTKMAQIVVDTGPVTRVGAPVPERVIIERTVVVGDRAFSEVRAEVMDGRENGGVICPCCDQRAQVYRRTITATSARALVLMLRAGADRDYVYLPDVLDRKQADEAKMRYWGLIEEKQVTRADGGRAGYWRLTTRGAQFAKGEISVPKYALVYDSECLRLDGPGVTIHDALGERFRLDELLAGSASS